MKFGWLSLPLVFLLGSVEAQVGQPGNFDTAIGSLSAKLLIKRLDADTYEISYTDRVQHDPARRSIFVRPIGEKLGDQGISMAVMLLPNWCQTPFVRTSQVFTDALTKQMAESQRLLVSKKHAYATRLRLGQCEISTVSNGWDSFIQMRFVGGQGVWPAQKLSAVKVQK